MDKKIVAASSLKVGGYVILNDKACKVNDIQISKTGKHGHAKCRITAISLIDNSKIIKVYPGTDKIEVPIIEKESAQILSIAEDTATVMDMKTYETFDLKLPEDLKGEVKEGDQINYWIILGVKVLQKK